MPEAVDNYKDEMTDDEFEKTLESGMRSDSSGVIVFTLKKAIEQNRTGIIKKMFLNY